MYPENKADMKEEILLIKSSIPPSESDRYLLEWGYDLLDDYISLVKRADFKPGGSVFEFATGTGRMTALLTRLNFKVITGDQSFAQIAEAGKRITNGYLSKVEFISLNLESTPFKRRTLDNITCVNTLHHLDNPVKCINELISAHSGKGKMLLADFNGEGFDVMDRLHKVRYGNIHPRGLNVWEEINDVLKDEYSRVEEVSSTLNWGLIAQNKRR